MRARCRSFGHGDGGGKKERSKPSNSRLSHSHSHMVVNRHAITANLSPPKSHSSLLDQLLLFHIALKVICHSCEDRFNIGVGERAMGLSRSFQSSDLYILYR